MHMWRTQVIGRTALAMVASLCWGHASGAATESVVGRQVTDFVLPDVSGNQVALSDFGDSRVLVVIFMGTQCPIANSYIPDLNALQKKYRDQGVQIVGINANLADTSEEIGTHVDEFQIDFPVLIDKQQIALDTFGADRTPDAFVLDRRRVIRYRGRIDDRVGYTHKRDQARRADLEEAVIDLVEGEDVEVAETKAMGCKITRRSSLHRSGDITYASHAAKILHERCANCHRPDTAAPFSLLSYEDARDWSEMMKEVITQRRMPPWDIDTRHGNFKNDLRMTKDEIDTLVAWIDDGAPLGDQSKMPAPPQFAPGWMIGEPDLVFAMPEEYTVPASGTVEYQYFVTPTNLNHDVWVKAAEPRPGNRSVVHHIIVWVRPEGSEEREKLPMVAGFAPGEEPNIHPDGVGMKIPAGSELLWQVHYTPYGKQEIDRSEIGLVLYDEPPTRHADGGGIFNFKFEIPAGAENHRVETSKTFKKDIELLSLMPHMHVRGKDFRYTAKLPDGTSKILLNVPNYDFNWQHSYKFAEPIFLPAGTTIECVAHYDNSAANPANPDPTKNVRWGDQTWEEMMIGWYSHVEPMKSDP